jgi:site-specific recombinase XerD
MASIPILWQNHASQTATLAGFVDALKQRVTQNTTLRNNSHRYSNRPYDAEKTIPHIFMLNFATHLPKAGTDLRYTPSQHNHSSNKTTTVCTQKSTIRIISTLNRFSGDVTSALSKLKIEKSGYFVRISTSWQ